MTGLHVVPPAFASILLVHLRRLFSLTWSAGPREFVLVMALIVLDGLTTGAFAVGLRMLLDGAIRADLTAVIVAALLGGFAHGMDAAGNRAKVSLQVVMTDRMSIAIERMTIDLVAETPGLAQMEMPQYQDRLSWVRERSEDLAWTWWALIESMSLLVKVVISVVLLVSVHPLLIMLPLFALPALWFSERGGRLVARAELQTATLLRLERDLMELIIRPSSAKETRLSGADEVLADRCTRLWGEATNARLRARVAAALLELPGGIVFAAGYVGALLLVGLRLYEGVGTPGEFLLVVALGNRIRGQVRSGAETLRRLSGSIETLDQFEWLIQTSRAARRPIVSPVAMPQQIREGIELRGVSFQYPQTDRQVLNDINLFLPRGGVVALVGENGAGKTTLVKLLSRFYEPTEGMLLVDRVDAVAIPPAEWRTRMSASFQDFFCLEMLAHQSVGIGDLPRIDDRAAVVAAVKRAGAEEILAALPNGLDCQLGARFEGGVDLSGGQWQRVALSRMTMREAPLILVLDEPTAALDAAAEALVFERYISHSRASAEQAGTITVLVTHRFSTVRDADLIVVLDKGRIVDRGSHAELMTRDGLYRELYSLQATGYR